MWVTISVKQNTDTSETLHPAHQLLRYIPKGYLLLSQHSLLHVPQCNLLCILESDFQTTNSSPHSTLVNTEITESFVSKKCQVQHVAATSSSLPQNQDPLVIHLLCCILNFIVYYI